MFLSVTQCPVGWGLQRIIQTFGVSSISVIMEYLSTCHGVVENEVGTLKRRQVIENHDLQMKNMKVL